GRRPTTWSARSIRRSSSAGSAAEAIWSSWWLGRRRPRRGRRTPSASTTSETSSRVTAEPRTVPGAESTDGAGQSVVDGLVRLLDLEPIEENIFRGVSPKVSLQRVFGGQVAGQAMVA